MTPTANLQPPCLRCERPMVCSLVVQHTSKGSPSGRRYTYHCECGEVLRITDSTRLMLELFILLVALPFAGWLLMFGAGWIIEGLTKHDHQSSVVLVIGIVFTVLALPLTLGLVWFGFTMFRDLVRWRRSGVRLQLRKSGGVST